MAVMECEAATHSTAVSFISNIGFDHSGCVSRTWRSWKGGTPWWLPRQSANRLLHRRCERSAMTKMEDLFNAHLGPGPRLVGPEGEEIELPESVFRVLRQVVHAMAQDQAVTVVPVHKQLTTQQAADLLGVSRPYLVRVLDEGQIRYSKPGTHRRLWFDDLMAYARGRDAKRREGLARLTEDERGDGPVEANSSPEVRAAAAGCWSRKHSVLGENSLSKVDRYRDYRELYWCGDGEGTSVYGYSRNRWGVIHLETWHFRGHVDSSRQWGSGWTAVQYFTQGRFEQCAVHCFREKLPWVEQRGDSNGAYGTNGNGG